MFSRILIANRGEIAVRIIRACKELGISTVAVYSTADENCLHVSLADEAICIGPPAGKDSYLNIPAIMSAAEIADVDAIHPGYGFLAENAHFAEVCESCNITFIGPSPENIVSMGDKVRARELMKQAGLPVIPGSEDKIDSVDQAVAIARKVGYPVMIKAAAGGGGKGMRVCHNDMSLKAAFTTAQREAEAAFGDGGLYIEKFIVNPRHIEVQLLADRYGNVVHLWERDCSIQRRHQKLIEEAPSPVLTHRQRERLGELAVRGAKAVGYSNVGTMEFLMDENGDFYFIEMNTRIQVEHPVTEMITGIDLVKEQILMAAGERLKFRQRDVKISGHAIECRINAEDWQNNFMPSPGLIEYLYVPGGRGVRVDTHIYAGYSIPPFYDSLLAKLISFGKDRQEAITIMMRALDEFVVYPNKTVINLHQEILSDACFQAGDFSTAYIEERFEDLIQKGGGR